MRILPRRRGGPGGALLALLLVSACAAPREGTEKEAEPPPPEPPPFPVQIEGAESSLLLDARRELKAFHEHGHRPADAADAALVMEDRLRADGYAHARVAFEIGTDTLLFRVQRGPRGYLHSLGFEGTRAFSKDEFAHLFVFPGSGPLGAGQPLYVRSQIDAAAAELETFYLLRGYYRVAVRVDRVGWNGDKTEADVTIAVDEGIRYEVTRIEFEGIEPTDLGLVGHAYEARLPVQAAAGLRRKLLDEGYQRCKIDGTAEIDDETGACVLRFAVDRGPQVEVGKVGFGGNERTKTRFLRRRAALAEGEILTQDLLDGATSRLYRTGLFQLVRPRLSDAGDDVSDVLFDLKESLARSVDLEIGYGSYELIRGAVRFTDRNFLGIGRTFNAEVNGSVRGGGVEFGIRDPYILGDRNVLEVETGYLRREEPSYDLQSFHASVLVKREISKIWSAHGGYSFRDEQATNVKVPIDEEAEGFIRTAGLVFGVTRDTRDSSYLPTRGTLISAAILWSSPALGADLDFFELDTGLTQLFRLRPGTVFGISGRFRARTILDDRTDLPIQQRYFLGGATTVRSFYEDQLGPIENTEPRGGLTALEASAELRQRLRGELYGAAFFDYGMIDVEGFSVRGLPGFAIGVGARYYLPVGPIRFDVAYNPGDLFAADARWAFHLAFGFSF
ncbi:MAG TPA: BamA/TamA family outer membrane protein [Planctomycetota bacterium]|nr:BamA/TamA family outer membrane protein [Planctomycetota bacterium]